MARGKIGIIGGGMVLAGLMLIAAPASTFSLFGVTLASAHPANAADMKVQGGMSDQARQFVNDVIANADENSCTPFQGQAYDVCTQYLYNSVFDNLVSYYKYANSDDSSAAYFVNNRLGARYIGQANDLIRERVASWPEGNYEVDAPTIRILSMNADPSADTATLRTQETWLATDESHNVIFREQGVYHAITMARVPSYTLHKWVVTDIE